MKLVFVALAAALFVMPAAAQTVAQQRQLDAAVMSAIARGDLRHARDLAVTAEHWQWISDARAPSGPKTRSEIRRDMARSQECADARRSYEVESTRIKRNWAALDANRQAVRVACGSTRY